MRNSNYLIIVKVLNVLWGSNQKTLTHLQPDRKTDRRVLGLGMLPGGECSSQRHLPSLCLENVL